MATTIIQDAIQEVSLTIKSKLLAQRPDGLMENGADPRQSHWECTLASSKHSTKMVVHYSQGSAYRVWTKGPDQGKPVDINSRRTLYMEENTKPQSPELASVLESLIQDSASYDNAASFEEWASEFGFDTDSRKAEACYRLCGDHSKLLARLLGKPIYDRLIEASNAGELS